MFRNREEAGRQLGAALGGIEMVRPLVLGVPRGGVEIIQIVRFGGGVRESGRRAARGARQEWASPMRRAETTRWGFL